MSAGGGRGSISLGGGEVSALEAEISKAALRTSFPHLSMAKERCRAYLVDSHIPTNLTLTCPHFPTNLSPTPHRASRSAVLWRPSRLRRAFTAYMRSEEMPLPNVGRAQQSNRSKTRRGVDGLGIEKVRWVAEGGGFTQPVTLVVARHRRRSG